MKQEKAKVHYSHNTDHWATPTKMYEEYIKNGFIDPCPLYCEEDNRNKIYKNQKIFINPQYSDIKNWVQFIKNNIKDNQIHLLIPARTDTKYFHELLLLKPTIVFIKGRLKFNNSKNSAPCPSIIMKFNYWNLLPLYSYESN